MPPTHTPLGVPPQSSPIPHIVHQTWRSSSTIPRGLASRCVASWRRLQPRWQYAFHSDDDNHRLVRERYPWLQGAYSRFSPIQRADLARYLYMHAFGGVYADLDVELLKPLGPLLKAQRWRHNASVILGQEPLAHAVLLEHKPRQVCNAVIASAPGHPFWLAVLRRVERGGAFADPVLTTGPRMLEVVFNEWTGRHGGDAGGVVVVPPDTFYPTWDPMQAETFRQRCRSQASSMTTRFRRRSAGKRGGGDIEGYDAVCARLRREGFVPTIPGDGSAYANHLWTHTWIPGASKTAVLYGG